MKNQPELARSGADNTPSSSNYSAFDEIAPSYDAIFTESFTIRAQRRMVLRLARQIFRAGDRILELNCGTGEDALFLARSGMSVVACDASEQMISVAVRRKSNEGPNLPISLLPVPTERIRSVGDHGGFDGVFSNFSGLNFVRDLRQVAEDLAALTRAEAPLLLCFAPRFCLSEAIWSSVRLDFRNAFRRWSRHKIEHVGSREIEVWYRSLGELRAQFAPLFRCCSIRAVGLCVPAYRLEAWARRHQRILELAEQCDRLLSRVPLLRAVGDHVLFHFEKRAEVL